MLVLPLQSGNTLFQTPELHVQAWRCTASLKLWPPKVVLASA